jgi:type I restriction enzyme S subunit
MKGIVPQLETAAKTDNGDNRKRVKEGDFVINSRSDRKGSAGVSGLDGSVSVISTVLTPRSGLDSQFVHYLLRSQPFQEEYYRFGTGIVADLWSTRYSAMKRIMLAIPPFAEQQSLANFLDRETAQMDELIGKQAQLVELLAEKRQAVITHAVTKGLDPAAPTKPSGVPWLGEVGAGWKLVELKHVVDVLTGFPFKSEDFSEQPEDVRLLRGVNINPGKTNWADTVRFAESQSRDYAAYRLELGDLVLGLDRPLVSDGTRVCAIGKQDLPSLLLQRVARIRTSSHANQEFIGHLLSSSVFANYLEPLFTGVSVPHMSPGQLGEFKIALPSLDEQKDIVRGLRITLNKIDVLRDRAERAIRLLRERRSALISAAVTGKIEVRKEACQS